MFSILLLFLLQGLQAQFYEYGQDAGMLRWWQMQTPHYRIIFPEGVDSVARTFGNRLEAAYPLLGKPLDHQHSPMPVVVHNESSFSNGVFVWAPKRLEIFSNPDPNAYNQDWLTQLAVHEGRHAVQIDKLNQGFTRGLYFLGGEQLVGAMAIFLPYWYLEGDAVDAETRLTLSGRGRQPSFEMKLKAQMLEGEKLYSFSKATMGSYRNYIPNHYELGYLMVRYGRRSYGDEFWVDFQNHAARKPFLLNPTWFSMRQYGLKNKSQFYREALQHYGDHWNSTDSARKQSPATFLSPSHKHYTSYRFPQAGPDSSVYVLRSGMDQIPELIRMDSDGSQEGLFRPGFMNSGRVSFSSGLAVWDEYVPDTRWSNRNYAVLRLLDLETGKVRNLGRRTRYFAPTLSPDGSLLAAIEQNERQEYSLVILDLEGNLIKKMPSPRNEHLQQPAWSDKGDGIVLLGVEGTEKELLLCDWERGSWDVLFNAGTKDISYPVVNAGRIYFSGTFSGIDNIYSLELEGGQVYQLTSSRFGAFQPSLSADGSRLLYSDYHAGGYRIAEMDPDSALWIPLSEVRDPGEQLDSEPSPEEERISEGKGSHTDTSYSVRRYRKIPHLFNVHSWLPLYVDYLDPTLSLDPEQLPVSLGLSLVSQNHLSTAVSQIAYEYKDGFHYFHSGIKLKGRYPVLNLYFDYGGEPDVLIYNDPADTLISLPRDLSFSAETYIPFRLNTGKFLTLVQPSIDYRYNRDLQYIEESAQYRSGTHFLMYSLYATSYLRKGVRDIWPRLGMSLNGAYFHAPFDNRVYGAVSYGSLYGYLPGILQHQSLRLSFHRQQQKVLDESRPVYVNLISLPRGMRGIFAEDMSRYSADYVFPLLYPDLGHLFYVKRIRAQIWADYLVAENVVIRDPDPRLANKEYGSAGLDLWLDLNVFRISFPLSLGLRVGYESQNKSSFFDLLYAIDIN